MKEKNPAGLSDKVGLPLFTYHPDPLATGSVEVSNERCACCGGERGYVYAAPLYAAEVQGRGPICPWCIADGAAAARFGAMYSDAGPLIAAGVSETVIEEVTQRTPGFRSWQPPDWKCCCGDACEFHGQPSRAHLGLLAAQAVEHFLSLTRWTPEQWTDFVSDVYEPGGKPTVYEFICRSCNKQKYGWDGNDEG